MLDIVVKFCYACRREAVGGLLNMFVLYLFAPVQYMREARKYRKMYPKNVLPNRQKKRLKFIDFLVLNCAVQVKIYDAGCFNWAIRSSTDVVNSFVITLLRLLLQSGML